MIKIKRKEINEKKEQQRIGVFERKKKKKKKK